VVPIAAHELDYRYAISAVPFACLALGLVCIRRPAPSAEAVSAPVSGPASASAPAEAEAA
jgi:hypothetical protein